MATENKSRAADQDLPDSDSDNARLQPEETILELPDVEDIPGQENIHPAPLGQLADVTISSDDEEDILNGDSLDSLGGNDEDADNHDTIGLP